MHPIGLAVLSTIAVIVGGRDSENAAWSGPVLELAPAVDGPDRAGTLAARAAALQVYGLTALHVDLPQLVEEGVHIAWKLRSVSEVGNTTDPNDESELLPVGFQLEILQYVFPYGYMWYEQFGNYHVFFDSGIRESALPRTTLRIDADTARFMPPGLHTLRIRVQYASVSPTAVNNGLRWTEYASAALAIGPGRALSEPSSPSSDSTLAESNSGLGAASESNAAAEAAADAPNSTAWICTSHNSTDSRTSMLRLDFSIPDSKIVASASVSVVGMGQFRVSLNGVVISGNTAAVNARRNHAGLSGSGEGGVDANAPGWTTWSKRILYSTYAINPRLFNSAVMSEYSGASSNNTIGVVLGNGMYNVPDPSPRYTKWDGSFGPRMLLFWMLITFLDGSTQLVDSSTSAGWLGTDGGPIQFTHVYAGEDYNATLEMPGWDTPGFSRFPSHSADPLVRFESNPLVAWAPVQDCGALNPGGLLMPSVFEPVQVMEILPSVSIVPSTSPTGSMLVDVGRNFAGFATVNVSGVPAGLGVRVWPSETMINGSIVQDSGGTPMYWQYFTPSNASSSGGLSINENASLSSAAVPTFDVTVQPTFSTYGWRWLEVQLIYPNGTAVTGMLPNVTEAQGHFTRSSVQRVSNWTSSNEWVNRIHNITVEAVASNLQSVLTDCPHRERLGWLEVSHLMFPSIAYNYDISNLWSKIAMDTVDSQITTTGSDPNNGMVPDIAPEYTVFSGGFRDSPEWGSASILNPYWLNRWYGIAPILNATYDTGYKYVNYLLGKVSSADGLLEYGLGDWIPVINSPIGVTATATLVQDLQAMASAAAALGKASDAANFTDLAARVASAYEAAYWNQSNASSPYPTQCAAGMALLLNITSADHLSAAQQYLLSDVITRGNVTTSGEIGNRYALLALAEIPGGAGIDAVWASLLRTDAPGYGWMLTMGETALAETWFDSPSDSHIHAMYGHVDEFLYKYVAGIRPHPNPPAPASVSLFENDDASTSPRGMGWDGYPVDGRGTLVDSKPASWDAVLLAPRLLPGLDWLSVSFESPRGLIHVSYNVTREEGPKSTSSTGRDATGSAIVVEMAVEVPPGVAAEVILPLTHSRLRITSGKQHMFSDRR